MPPKKQTISSKPPAKPTNLKKGGKQSIDVSIQSDELVFKLVEGIPKSTYGLSESVFNSLVSNLRDMQPNKNHLPFSLSHKLMVGKIIKDNFPDYVVKYSTNKEKGTCAVWRTA